MPTITNSLGSAGGRDFSTVANWIASLPANLVTDGNSYRGECYNDSEFATVSVFLSGHTTDATHTITLTTAAGQSFRDNVNAQINPFTYDASKGVGLNSLATGNEVMTIDDQNVFLSNLQFKSVVGPLNTFAGPFALITIDDCIFYGGSSTDRVINGFDGNGSVIRNSLIINAGSGSTAGINGGQNGLGAMYNCTIVAPSDLGSPPANAIRAVYNCTQNAMNCAFFGFATVGAFSGTPPTFTTCMTDVASPPSGVTGGKTYGNQFQNTTSVSGDWREKAGADLLDAGTLDATNGAFDIVGTARPQGGNSDIGAWELVVGGGDTLMAAMVM